MSRCALVPEPDASTAMRFMPRRCDLRCMHDNEGFIPLRFTRRTTTEMTERARAFAEEMNGRRSVRHFSRDPVPVEIINELVRAANTAPSGAHKQPWTFVAVGDLALKQRIREAAEAEERANYGGRMSEEWLADLKPLGTDAHKPFLEEAPWLIVVFKRVFEVETEGHKHQNYYVNESVGIATGLLLAAAHRAGLVSLTHTPSPMNFLKTLLRRPDNERPFLLIPMGFPADDCVVPKLRRKSLDQVMVVHK